MVRVAFYNNKMHYKTPLTMPLCRVADVFISTLGKRANIIHVLPV